MRSTRPYGLVGLGLYAGDLSTYAQNNGAHQVRYKVVIEMNKRDRERAKALIESFETKNGGYTKETIMGFGVSWPPPKGWKEKLIRHVAKLGTIDGFDMAKKAGKGFYQSWEWKSARYEALKVHGRRCQCCGWRPGDTEHGYLVVDHIKPRSKRPELALDVSNLQVMCNDCNMGKSNVWEDDFREVEDWFTNLMRE